MRRNRVIYVILILICTAFTLAYQSRLAAVLLVAAAAYPILALAAAAISLYCIRASFTVPRAVYEKKEEFEIRIAISSRFPFAYAPAELECTLPDHDTGVFTGKRVYASASPLGSCRISVAGMHRFRGCYTAQINRIAVYDPFRLIRLSRRANEQMQLVFLPRKISIGELVSAAGVDSSTFPVPFSGEKEDFSHVKEYLPGDIVQLVHWKLTAKRDELMIKQFDDAAQRRIAVLCDLGSEPSGTIMLKADCIIETAIAFVMSAVRSGISATVDFGDLNRSFSCSVSDRPSFESFYNMMTLLPAKLETADFTELVRRYAVSGACSLFLVTASLTEDMITFTDHIAESFRGTVVLAHVNIGTPAALTAAAREKRFLLLDIHADTENALIDAIEAMQEQ